jgi:hypothetical protein
MTEQLNLEFPSMRDAPYSEALPPLGAPDEEPSNVVYDYSSGEYVPFTLHDSSLREDGTRKQSHTVLFVDDFIYAKAISVGGGVGTAVTPSEISAAGPIQALRYNTGKAKLSYTPMALLEAAARGLASDAIAETSSLYEIMDQLLYDAYAWIEGQDACLVTNSRRLDLIAASTARLLHVHATGRPLAIPPSAVGLSIVPRALVEGASRAMVYGANKYARNNWRKGFPHTELMDCLLRHAFAWLSGEDCDAESGLHHFDHIAANIAFLAHMQKTNGGIDDRCINI